MEGVSEITMKSGHVEFPQFIKKKTGLRKWRLSLYSGNINNF